MGIIELLDQEYKEMFTMLTVELGRTPRFNEAFELMEWHRLECVKVGQANTLVNNPGSDMGHEPGVVINTGGVERGVGGGRLAECVVCHEVWERPAQRGRPSLRCPGCR